MDSQKFKQWLVNVKGQKESAAAARVAGAMRIDAEYDIYNNYYVVGKKDDLMELFKYSRTDEKHGVHPLVNITINGNIYDGMASLRQALKLYFEFLDTTNVTPTPNMPTTPKVSKTPVLSDALEPSGAPATKNIHPVFIGNFAEFKHFIGGYCRNIVAQYTRKEKKNYAGCEYCQAKAVLQAAHRQGQSRIEIIYGILEKEYKTSTDFYEVPLIDFEKKFKNAHKPVKDHFFFLCPNCHSKYDNGILKDIDIRP